MLLCRHVYVVTSNSISNYIDYCFALNGLFLWQSTTPKKVHRCVILFEYYPDSMTEFSALFLKVFSLGVAFI